MLRRFLSDKRGNYAMMTVLMMVPLMGGLALAIDYSQMTRQRQLTLNALDAAGVATARRVAEGATDEQLHKYAREFFAANLNGVDASDAVIELILPKDNTGGGTLKISAQVPYKPYFYGPFAEMMGEAGGDATLLTFSAVSEVRLKNTLEVALVLDNSGSMDYKGSGSGKKRMELLKSAAKQLVDTIAAEGAQLKQIEKPVQFAVVPFAASVNVGPSNRNAGWLDQDGISPVHHENFDWTTFTASNKKVQKSGGVFYKKGTGWGAEENQKVTRFTLFDELKRQTGTNRVKTGTVWGCISTNWWGGCTGYGNIDVYADVPIYGSYASWGGCVEVRPYPYSVDDTAPSTSNGATLFVPMFAPDETDRKDSWSRNSENSWWADGISGSDDAARQRYMQKYFTPAGSIAASETGQGPNASCTTKPITPLTDVGTSAGLKTVKDAIDDMESLGATNVPEGLGWGWRVLSSGVPFNQGRPESEHGNDKVVIVLTDGQNTYYTPTSLGYNDLAGNKSTYSAYGYTNVGYNGTSTTRLFQDTSGSIGKSDYSNGNYSNAMNEQFAKLCGNAKGKKIIIMAVSLDLSTSVSAEKAQIDALKACASDSKFRKEGDKPAKLFWNATGGKLEDTFKEIADELSNLRIVS